MPERHKERRPGGTRARPRKRALEGLGYGARHRARLGAVARLRQDVEHAADLAIRSDIRDVRLDVRERIRDIQIGCIDLDDDELLVLGACR